MDYDYYDDLFVTQDKKDCMHSWVAGMMYVHDEDLDDIAAVRKVECEKCDKIYKQTDEDDTDPANHDFFCECIFCIPGA